MDRLLIYLWRGFHWLGFFCLCTYIGGFAMMASSGGVNPYAQAIMTSPALVALGFLHLIPLFCLSDNKSFFPWNNQSYGIFMIRKTKDGRFRVGVQFLDRKLQDMADKAVVDSAMQIWGKRREYWKKIDEENEGMSSGHKD